MPDRTKTTQTLRSPGKLAAFPSRIKTRRGAAEAEVPTSASSMRGAKREVTQLQLPQGEPDLVAITAVIGDWLVPLLVKEFLAEHDASTSKCCTGHKP